MLHVICLIFNNKTDRFDVDINIFRPEGGEQAIRQGTNARGLGTPVKQLAAAGLPTPQALCVTCASLGRSGEACCTRGRPSAERVACNTVKNYRRFTENFFNITNLKL